MLSDKAYALADSGLMFNITGYAHPESGYFASLKYVEGEKWTHGYSAATEFLRANHPAYVWGDSGYIWVPQNRIQATYDPIEGWQEILQNPERSRNHRLAVDLASELATILSVPLTEFAITDSLLWGEGHDQSDIDLLVVGQQNAIRVLEQSQKIYDHADFARPDPEVMKSPYGITVGNWPRLLDRKLHMGDFRGSLFSLRAVRTASANTAYEPRLSSSMDSIEFSVADVGQSLFFPAVYLNDQGDRLVDYSVLYEGVFRRGETVKCEAIVEDQASCRQFVISGECAMA